MEGREGRCVVLIRAPKGPEDAYKKVIQQAGFSVHFVKALCFEYVNSEQLASALERKHGGLIFTSQTAVESTIQAISTTVEKEARFVEKWSDVPVFVVGKATAMAVKQIGLETTGAACGNAEILAKTILEFFADKDIQSIHPLLFPCGNLARDTVSCELERVGLKVTRIVCYNTLRHPGIDESLKTLSQYKVFNSQCCIVFFSPSGVEFVLPFLKAHCDIKITKVIAIGPTTAASLKQVGLSPVTAHTPTPEALLAALHQCFINCT